MKKYLNTEAQRHKDWVRFSLCLCASVFSFYSVSLPAVAPDRVPCVEVLQLHFFDPFMVNQALSLYEVRRELWVPIVEELKERSKEVPAMMIARSARMVPNPLEYPMQRLPTAQLLQAVLSDVFAQVLARNYVSEPFVVKGAFNYILNQQRENFVRCFGEEVNPLFEDVP